MNKRTNRIRGIGIIVMVLAGALSGALGLPAIIGWLGFAAGLLIVIFAPALSQVKE